MSCDHCVNAVTSEVSAIDGVTSVDVDLDGGLVTVTSETELDDAAFAEAIDEAGFEVGSS
jgi:copper chaperone CopZ